MAEPKTVWARLRQRALSKKWIIGLGVLAAVALALADVHDAAVFLFCLVGLTAVLLRASDPGLPAAIADPAEAQDAGLDRLAVMFNALETPILVVAADEAVILQNAAAETLFGAIPANTYLSARVRSPAILEMVRDTMVTGNANQIEYSERFPSEIAYVVRVALAEIDAAPPLQLYILSYRDVSQAGRIERMRSDFVANASHELRTPLASLRGFIETLQGPARNDVKAHEKFLGIMLEQTTRMSRLVDDLLSLSRLELKSHIAPNQTVDLRPLLTDVRDALTPLAENLDVAITLTVPDEAVVVQGDRDELIEVFENLVENACKYGQEGKHVEVALSGGGDRPVEVSVRDHGPGIPAEHVPRITERFYRVNVEASRSKKGTGLGLAIVKHILTRHRARLLVQSEVGKGTVFTVRF